MADKYFYRDSVTTKVRYTRGRFEGWTEPSGLLNAPYAIFRTAKTVIYVPQYSLMAETRQRLPQPGQPSEIEKRFQEGIKEAEDFAARFLAEHGEVGNEEYFPQPSEMTKAQLIAHYEMLIEDEDFGEGRDTLHGVLKMLERGEPAAELALNRDINEQHMDPAYFASIRWIWDHAIRATQRESGEQL